MLIVAIMAGGLGKRMKSDLPKVLHILNGYPILVHVIRAAISLHKSGEDLLKIYVIVGKYYELIKETLESYLIKDELRFVDYVFQYEPKGTGHAVQQLLPILKDYDQKTKVMVLSGDVPLITTKTLLGLLGTYDFTSKETKENAVIITTHLDDPTGNGRILRDFQGIFQRIVEEKDANEEEKSITEVNAGIYLFCAKGLLKYLPKIKNDNAQNEYYLPDVLPLMKSKDCRIVSYILDRSDQYELLNINDQEDLREAERILDIRPF